MVPSGVVRRPLSDHAGLKCTLGDVQLDTLMRGGIPCGSITELVGEASVGKTQTCMQLLMTVQWPVQRGGLDGCALYIYTEGDPPLTRLVDIARHHSCRAGDPREHVYVERGVSSGEELLQLLVRIEKQLQSPPARRLRLIIIDSVANVFRDAGNEGGGRALYANRAAMFFRVAALLKRYADVYQLAVVCVNQVSDVITAPDGSTKAPPTHTGGLQLRSSGREVQPALGLAWATCVNHRLFLSRDPQPFLVAHADGARTTKQVLRRMQVVFSPYLPQSSCPYLVEQAGLRSIAAAEVQQGLAWGAELAQREREAEQQEEQRLLQWEAAQELQPQQQRQGQPGDEHYRQHAT